MYQHIHTDININKDLTSHNTYMYISIRHTYTYLGTEDDSETHYFVCKTHMFTVNLTSKHKCNSRCRNLSYAMRHFNTDTRFTFPIAPTHSEKNGNIHCNHSNIVFKVISTYQHYEQCV